MPDIPDHVSIDEIESHLDRVALEIEATGATCLVPIFEWLEQQLEDRRRHVSALARIADRAKKRRPIGQDRAGIFGKSS